MPPIISHLKLAIKDVQTATDKQDLLALQRAMGNLSRLRDDVMEATAGRQEPHTYGSLPGSEVFLQR